MTLRRRQRRVERIGTARGGRRGKARRRIRARRVGGRRIALGARDACVVVAARRVGVPVAEPVAAGRKRHRRRERESDPARGLAGRDRDLGRDRDERAGRAARVGVDDSPDPAGAVAAGDVRRQRAQRPGRRDGVGAGDVEIARAAAVDQRAGARPPERRAAGPAARSRDHRGRRRERRRGAAGRVRGGHGDLDRVTDVCGLHEIGRARRAGDRGARAARGVAVPPLVPERGRAARPRARRAGQRLALLRGARDRRRRRARGRRAGARRPRERRPRRRGDGGLAGRGEVEPVEREVARGQARPEAEDGAAVGPAARELAADADDRGVQRGDALLDGGAVGGGRRGAQQVGAAVRVRRPGADGAAVRLLRLPEAVPVGNRDDEHLHARAGGSSARSASTAASS